MIEAVGHNYFGSYVRALDDLLAPGGIVVLQAIMMPEHRYEEYIRSADFINTVSSVCCERRRRACRNTPGVGRSRLLHLLLPLS